MVAFPLHSRAFSAFLFNLIVKIHFSRGNCLHAPWQLIFVKDKQDEVLHCSPLKGLGNENSKHKLY